MAERPSSINGLQTIAVTGATGVVGQFVVQRLLTEGVRVRAAGSPSSEQKEKAQETTSLLDARTFDMDSAASATELLDGCDALVHCAFSHVEGRYRGGEGNDPEGFLKKNLGATVNLLDACSEVGVERAVIMSSRAVFGKHSKSTVNDESTVAPDTLYGKLKATEERQVQIAVRNKTLDVACLRATGVYGRLAKPSASKWFDYCTKIHKGEPLTEVDGGTQVHGADVAQAIWILLTTPKGSLNGQAFNCSDQWISTRMIARTLNDLTRQNLPLPDPIPTRHLSGIMHSNGLRRLGWQPGGYAQFKATLERLLADAANAQAHSRGSPSKTLRRAKPCLKLE